MRRPSSSFLLALFVATIVTSMSAQQTPAPQPTGAISGVVVDGVTGATVSDAIVTLGGSPLPAGYRNRQVSDAKGRFAFLNVPDGPTFTLSLAKFGSLDGGYGRDSGPLDELRAIPIVNGAWVPNLRVSFWRGGTISGVVRDETGEPVVGVFVRALAKIRVAGRDDVAAGPVTLSNDHGEFRLTDLHPGRYLVQVPSVYMSVPAGFRVGAAPNVAEGAMDIDDTVRLLIGGYPLPPAPVGGRAMSYAAAFHPNGSSLGSASIIDLSFGDERTSIDVTLSPSPAVRVSGTVEGPPEALASLTVRLVPSGFESLGPGSEVATALVAANGTFSFLNVPAGSYTLDAPVKFTEFRIRAGAQSTGGTVGSWSNASLPTSPARSGTSSQSQLLSSFPGLILTSTDIRGGAAGFSGRMPIAVGSTDITGVTLKMRPHLTMRGRVVFEPDPRKPVAKLPRAYLQLDPAGGQPYLGMPGASAAAEGTSDFEIANVLPGEYWIRLFTQNWMIKSIQWRDRDYARAPLTSSATDDLSGVVVTVTNALPTLTGVVRAPEATAPDSGVVVVAFPTLATDRASVGLLPTRLRSASLDHSGRYTFNDLPSGDYVVAAIGRARITTWRDPEMLAAIERQAVRVTLNWSQTSNQDLTVVIK